mgnify:CR=1 FL=1
MQLTADNKLKKLIIVGDRVLIRLKKPNEKTGSGLYLPPGVQEKEKVQQGYSGHWANPHLHWFQKRFLASLRVVDLSQ